MQYSYILFLFTLIIAFPAHADIYKYTDADGVECYTDTPLGKKANNISKENTRSSATGIKRAKADSGRDVDYHDIVHEKASTYDLDPSLIKAVIKTESNWNDRAVSSKGAMGLMQLMPGTANDLNVRNPFDPEQNIEGGTKYLKHLIDRFNGDLTLALAAYNAGPNKVAKYGYVPPITETQQYVKKVLSHYNGTLTYPVSSGEPGTPGKKNELIYKIVMEDGSVLFTNSSLAKKEPVRF